MEKIDILIILFFLTIFVAAQLNGWYDVTTPVYEQGVVENREGAFNLPLLYYIGVVAHSAVGQVAFTFLPLMFLLVTVFYLIKAFNLFSLQKEIILIGFLSTSRWIPTLNFFNRDNLMFALASAFAYLFFKAVYKKSHSALLWQLPVLALMFFTKTTGTLFVFIFLIEVVYFFREKITSFFPAVVLGDMVKEHLNQILGAIEAAPRIELFHVLAFAANPVFGASAIVFLKKRKNVIHLGILALTLLSMGALFALGGGYDYTGRFLRYTNPLIPFHLFLFAYAVGEVRGLRWIKVLGVFAVAKIVSGYFYLDAVWKVFM